MLLLTGDVYQAMERVLVLLKILKVQDVGVVTVSF